MNCKEFTSLIDSYLQGVISEDQQENFEKHYFECDHCFLELQISEQLYNKKIRIEATSSKKVIYFKPLTIAASLLFLVFSSYIIINNQKQREMIYQISQFNPPVYLTSETRNNNSISDFSLAMDLYSKAEYKNAMLALEQFKDDPENPKIIFFRGICYLMENKLTEAILDFDAIISNTNPSYFDEALFYKGIALLRQGKKKKSVELLDSLSRMFSPYAPKAKRIIEKINKL